MIGVARSTGLALALALCGGALCAQETRARLEFEPASAEVGEPVRATVSVEHALGLRPKLDSLGLDDSWLVIDSKPGATLADPTAAGGARSRWVFEIVSLKPGERVIADVPLAIGDQKVALEKATLAVHGLLAENEDAQRPIKGLREIQTKDEQASLWLWGALAVMALAATLAAILLWVRRRGRSQVAAAPAPSIRLAVLESRPLDTPEDVQAAHFALTRLLRESADLRAGRDRSGLTDEEWRGDARAQFDSAGFSEAESNALSQLFERAAQVKYGTERPTHWATREALASARALAARLESGEAAIQVHSEVAA